MSRIINEVNYKEEFLSKLQWRGSEKRVSKSKADISITITKSNRMAFTFRNDTASKVSDTGYLAICPHKNRILFKAVDNRHGWAVSMKHKDDSKRLTYGYMQVPVESDADRAFEGDYELKYDDFLELYFIEKTSTNMIEQKVVNPINKELAKEYEEKSKKPFEPTHSKTVRRYKRARKEDVTVTKTGSRHRLNITFRNGSADHVTTTGYINVEFENDRMYFLESVKGKGYKASANAHNNSDNVYVQVYPDTLHADINIDGDYSLRYDQVKDLYFINYGKEN